MDRYKNEEWLKKEYGQKRRSSRDISDEFGVNPKTVWYWADKYNLNRYRRPWECEQLMYYLYITKDYSIQDLCNELNGTPPNIIKNLRELGISKNIKQSPPSRYQTEKGYVRIDGGTGDIYEHQLVAIANGANPHEIFANDKQVHHKNEIKWDNRPENLEVMAQDSHLSHHVTGVDNPGAKLCKQEVKQILKRYDSEKMTQKQLANEYGVSQSTISSVVRGDNWSHLV